MWNPSNVKLQLYNGKFKFAVSHEKPDAKGLYYRRHYGIYTNRAQHAYWKATLRWIWYEFGSGVSGHKGKLAKWLIVKAELPSKIRGINEYDVTWIRCLKSDCL